MNECNSVGINKINLSEQTKFRLSQINQISQIIFIKRSIKENYASKNLENMLQPLIT